VAREAASERQTEEQTVTATEIELQKPVENGEVGGDV
jgi:hypothetical protein